MKTLLHVCCAPCANMCIETLRRDGQELTAFWYNPNIHPFTEYRSRRNCLRDYAAQNGFDSFSSSLFISPYQNHELLKEVAERAADAFHVRFQYRDFRPLFRQGQERARELGFYIQKYCGCVFSEQERYLKPSKIIR